MGPATRKKVHASLVPVASVSSAEFMSTSNCSRDSPQQKSVVVYECIFCAAIFTNKAELDTHLPTHVTKSECGQKDAGHRSRERVLSCPICNAYTAWSEEELQQHLDNHVLGYKCVFCAFTTLKRTRLRSHLPQHAFERNFKCDLCGMGFFKKYLLGRHIKTHGPKDFACVQCDHTTYSQRMLNDHRALKHSSGKKHKCKECDEQFRHSADLSTHRRKIHNAQNTKFGKSDVKRCPDCTFETKRRPEFILHRYEVHESFPVIRQGALQLQCGMEGCIFFVDSEIKFVSHIQTKHKTVTASSSTSERNQQCLSCRLCRPNGICTHTSSGRSRSSKYPKNKLVVSPRTSGKVDSSCNSVDPESVPDNTNKDSFTESTNDGTKILETSHKGGQSARSSPRPRRYHRRQRRESQQQTSE